MIQGWIEEIKKTCDPAMLGMILAHNGIVRATTKDGKPVGKMNLTNDKGRETSWKDESYLRQGQA